MNDEPIKIEFGDELDLHHFHPKDVKDVLAEFIGSALSKGIKRVRIVHGKGISTIKTIIRKELERDPRVLSFNDDGPNWGATIVILK